MIDLNVLDDQMEVHQVKNITSNHGKQLDYSQLLLSNELCAMIHYAKEKNRVEFQIEDTNLNIPDFHCQFDKATLKDLIDSMRVMYSQLTEEEINANQNN
jgi:hypothetical protein